MKSLTRISKYRGTGIRVWTTRRICKGSQQLTLSLGKHYVSNFLSRGEADGIKAPLELVLCHRCRLLQLKHTVPAKEMYRNYWYRSGTNKTMQAVWHCVLLEDA